MSDNACFKRCLNRASLHILRATARLSCLPVFGESSAQGGQGGRVNLGRRGTRRGDSDTRSGGPRTVQDASQLAEQCADPLRAFGHLDVKQLLDGEGVNQFVGH